MTATAVRTTTPVSRSRSCEYAGPAAAAVVVLALATLSMFVGVSDVSLPALLTGDPTAVEIFWISRVLRTLAVVLAGMAVAVAGLIMQLMARNRFVEPSTVGTVESATLGILVVTVFIPTAPILLRMGVASVFAVLGTALFLAILRRLPTRNTLLIPLVGIMLGGVIAAVTTNLGLNYTATMRLGLIIVSLISAVVVTTVGAVPFLGLVVPNIVSLLFGDNLRRAVPWTALFGADFVLVCDIIGRTIRYPYEVPVDMVMAVLGAILFLVLILRKRNA
ncbi:MAG: iron chelate uptake ABC transporter family permease subunit [Pseudarthrobacter sp.]